MWTPSLLFAACHFCDRSLCMYAMHRIASMASIRDWASCAHECCGAGVFRPRAAGSNCVFMSRLSWCDSAREWQCEQHRVHAEWQEAGGSQSATGTAAKTQVGQVRGSVPRPPDARERRRRLETGGAGAPDTVLAHSLASRAPGAGGRCHGRYHGRCRRALRALGGDSHLNICAREAESVPSSAPPARSASEARGVAVGVGRRARALAFDWLDARKKPFSRVS